MKRRLDHLERRNGRPAQPPRVFWDHELERLPDGETRVRATGEILDHELRLQWPKVRTITYDKD